MRPEMERTQGLIDKFLGYRVQAEKRGYPEGVAFWNRCINRMLARIEVLRAE